MSQRIGVFLSSYTDVPEAFRTATEATGAWIGRTGRTLVYGGSGYGMMEVLARSTKQSGGRVFGVVPQIVIDRNAVSQWLDVEFRTADLHDRKSTLLRESDVLVALPGGIGTLDEVFTTLSVNSIGIASKPVVLFNVDGCWNALLDTLRQLTGLRLIDDRLHGYLHVVDSIEQLDALCATLPSTHS